MTPSTKPYRESGKLHYYKGHLADSGFPGPNSGPMKEMAKKFKEDGWMVCCREGYAMALYWLDGDRGAIVGFIKEQVQPLSKGTREKAEAAIRGEWKEKNRLEEVQILDEEIAIFPELDGSAAPASVIDWDELARMREAEGGKETG